MKPSIKTILMLCLASVLGTAAAQAQKTKPPPASGRLADPEARQLRDEAARDYERQNHSDALAKYLRVYSNYQDDFEVNQRIGWLYFNSPKAEYQKAIPYLRKAHSLDTQNLDVIHDLAKATSWARSYAESVALYRDLVRLSPNIPDYLLELARTLAWSGKSAEAATYFETYLTRMPSDEDARLEFAHLLAEQKDFTGAMGQYNYILRFHPGNASARLGLAQILAWTGQLRPSLDEVEKILKTNPRYFDARVVKAFDLLWLGQADEARPLFQALAKQDPRNPDVQQALQTIAKNEQAKAELSVSAAQAAQPPPATSPAPPPPLQLAEASGARREAGRAISPPASEEYLRALVQKDPENFSVHLDLANVLLNRKEFPGAIKELRAAAALKPEGDAFRLRLGKVLSWDREYAEAITIYRQWLEKHPDDQEVRLELARVLSWNKDYDASLAEYHQILLKTPENTETQLEIARVLGWARKYPQSVAAFDVVLRNDPKNYDAWLGPGRVYSNQRRWRQSLEAFDRALALKPGDRDAETGKAQVLLWSGETRSARRILDKLYAENPKDATVLLSLASAENSSGQPDKALDFLGKAASLDPQNVEVQILQDQVRSRLKPELRLGWSYVRDTEGLDIRRYQVLNLRFNLHPRIRSFISIDILPSSGPARVFGYAVSAPAGSPLCGAAGGQGCVVYSPRVPVTPYAPGPGLLSYGSFPPDMLAPASARIRQSAIQLQFGGTMQLNEWFSWTASGGGVEFRDGSPNEASPGFPSTRERAIYSASPTFRPNRHWEISFGVSRQYWTYTPKAISQTTRADEQSANITWSPGSRNHVGASLYHRGIAPEFLLPTVSILSADSTHVVGTFTGRAFHEHGNGGTLTATRTLWKGEKSQFEAGYDAMAFGYTHPTGLPFPPYYVNAGVFTPSFYQRHAALIRLTVGSKYVQWEVHGTAGAQQILQHSDPSFSSTAGSRLDFLVTRKATLSLGYDYFNTASALQALLTPVHAGGYHSNNLTANLDLRF